MVISEIRIYAEVLEQGLDFKEYVSKAGFSGPINNVYSKKISDEFKKSDSFITRIRKVKDVDVMISAISENREYPLLLVEYSTAVPCDDHRMQRSDVYFWSAIFKTPMMKISPENKGMNQEFGGGSNFDNELECYLANRNKAIFYPIEWQNEIGKDTLEINNNRLSCIKDNSLISKTIRKIYTFFCESNSFDDYYKKLYSDYQITYKESINKYNENDIKDKIPNSSRFTWIGNKLRAKINRFGHAMDPDRGVLHFINMLFGIENIISEIQVNRPENYNCRMGYKSLFDSVSRERELKQYVTDLIINQNNEFTDENALHILVRALNLDSTLRITPIAEHKYVIKDNDLDYFLKNHSKMAAKSIFYLSSELHLTDKDRKTICSITWNSDIVKKYLSEIPKVKFEPLNLLPLSNSNSKEDIITYASVELYKRLKYSLMAVSYPGAQGDRCILSGSGRNVLRDYIDIIAYKINENDFTVYLEECKEKISNSYRDADKLNGIISDKEKMKGLSILSRKCIGRSDIKKVFTSVGAKAGNLSRPMDVDYIFMFSISNTTTQSLVDYSVAVINTNLVKEFKPITKANGKIAGVIVLPLIYIIE